MEVKVFEVLAPGSKGAAVGIKFGPLDGTEGAIARAQGFTEDHVLVSTLKSEPNYITYDKYHWLHGKGGVERLGHMFLAHDEIESRWDELASGDTLDLTPRWDWLKDELQRLLTPPDDEP